ncbi:hypothetical protein BT63DRAFT_420646 [Microthyrium microscopicum]|uniref:Uncharacterized protein n=1 Tax=Microthyrium microscopicum TaxID=703497 RepID=A0A6A6UVL9_9PEZI|nr:hypothetical protein BT63DRAFT_420646 [Microthyrium microscopicum]
MQYAAPERNTNLERRSSVDESPTESHSDTPKRDTSAYFAKPGKARQGSHLHQLSQIKEVTGSRLSRRQEILSTTSTSRNKKTSSELLERTMKAPREPGSRQQQEKIHRSSSYVSWSDTANRSEAHFEFPKVSGAVEQSEFKFKPGPYRSSSLGAVRKSMDPSVQRGQALRRARSDQAHYSTNMSGELRSMNSREPSLPGSSPKLVDRQSLPQFQHSAINKRFEPQHSSRAPHAASNRDRSAYHPAMDPRNYSVPQEDSRPTRESGRKQTAEGPDDPSSSSLARLLSHCNQVQNDLEAMADNQDERLSIRQHRRGIPEDMPESYPDLPERRSTVDTDLFEELSYPDYPDGGGLDQIDQRSDVEMNGHPGYSQLASDSWKDDELPSRIEFGADRRVQFEEGFSEDCAEDDGPTTRPAINIPCVGGLRPDMLFNQTPERHQGDISGFWRPNRLY